MSQTNGVKDAACKVISTSNLYMPNLDSVCRYLDDAWNKSGRMMRHALVGELETRLATYHHAEHCVTFSTGFWALVAAIQIRALEGRDEVLIPSMTYRRLADVVYWSGKTPHIVDNDPQSLAISCDAVERSLSERSSLILAVHPIVNCCDVERLREISRNSGVPILFDAVESVHETVGGKRVGSFGMGEVFSLHASKLINGLEGGYVCTHDASFRDRLLQLRSSKRSSSLSTTPECPDLCEGHAAFALASLDEIENNVHHNRKIYRAYQRELRQSPVVKLLEFDETQQTSFKNIVVSLTPDFIDLRDELAHHLNDQGILAREHYFPSLHSKSYRYKVVRSDTPFAERAMRRLINLPCGHLVTEEDVVRTCRAIYAFLSNHKSRRAA